MGRSVGDRVAASGAGRVPDPLIKIYLREAGSIPMLSETEAVGHFKDIEKCMLDIKRVVAWFKDELDDIFNLRKRMDEDVAILDELSYFVEDGSRVKTLDDDEWRSNFLINVNELEDLVSQKNKIEEKLSKCGGALEERSGLLHSKRLIHGKISRTMENVKLHPLQVMNFSRKIISVVEKERVATNLEISSPVKRLTSFLKYTEEKIKFTKQQVTKSNLRLVVNIAKKYMDSGVPLMDLIQEGNLGLMRAVNRYDYCKGYHFSTYATWWIKQAVTRAIADQSKTVRVPVHMVEVLKKYRKANNKLIQKYGRKPTMAELAENLGMSEERMVEVRSYAKKAVSLDMPILDGEKRIEDILEDPLSKSPFTAVEEVKLQENMDKLLRTTLDKREEKILRMRFGLGEYTEHTLSEVGKKLGVCRERVRQLEKRSLKKLGKLSGDLCFVGA